MYKSSSDCEKAIKKFAAVYRIICYVLLTISVVTFLFTLIDFDDVLILGITCIFVAVTSFLSLLVVPFMWGFGDLIGNLGRLSSQTPGANKEDPTDVLPEL